MQTRATRQDESDARDGKRENDCINGGNNSDRRFTRLISFRSDNSINSLKRLEAFGLK